MDVRAPHLLFSDVPAVPCPAGSQGIDIPSGCACSLFWTGSVQALSNPPYFESTCEVDFALVSGVALGSVAIAVGAILFRCYVCSTDEHEPSSDDVELTDITLSERKAKYNSEDLLIDEAEVLDCLICFSEPGKLSLTRHSCGHGFCSDCTRRTIDSILELGQFPGRCPGCKGENAGRRKVVKSRRLRWSYWSKNVSSRHELHSALNSKVCVTFWPGALYVVTRVPETTSWAMRLWFGARQNHAENPFVSRVKWFGTAARRAKNSSCSWMRKMALI